jgi:uncharacterized protein YbcI
MTPPVELSPDRVAPGPPVDRAIVDGLAHEHGQWTVFPDRRNLLAICNAMVALYKEVFGRGPTKVRAEFAGQDVVVVVLEQTLTTAERNLLALGQRQRLEETRLIAHRQIEHRVRSIAERILDRRVVAALSAIDVGRDVAAEVLTLEPGTVSAGPDPGRPQSARGYASTSGRPHRPGRL